MKYVAVIVTIQLRLVEMPITENLSPDAKATSPLQSGFTD
jgi:hypothetical protein